MMGPLTSTLCTSCFHRVGTRQYMGKINVFVKLIAGTQKVNMLVEGQAEIKMFCKDYVERAEIMFILATLSCMLVVLSLVHFLMALSANYAHIRGQDKFTDLQVRIALSKQIDMFHAFITTSLFLGSAHHGCDQ